MNNVLAIRKRLSLSQKELGDRIGKSQGLISNVEVGRQDLMPDDARKIILVAKNLGVPITFDDIYGPPDGVFEVSQSDIKNVA